MYRGKRGNMQINPPIPRKFGPSRRRCICISLSRAPIHLLNENEN